MNITLAEIIPSLLPSPEILQLNSWELDKTATQIAVNVTSVQNPVREKSQPIAILKDREAETLAAWLKEHPGVEIVSRDRSRTYEKGVLQGAPNAIQVADRFHILQNLAEALAQVFGSQLKTLKEVEKLHTGSPARDANQTEIVALPPASNQTKKEVSKAIQRRERRVIIHQQVWELRRQGLSEKAIAKKLGIGCTTVFRYLRHSTFQERNGRSDRGRSKLDPYKDYLLEQWNQKCYDTKKLFEDIQKQSHSELGEVIEIAQDFTTLVRQRNPKQLDGWLAGLKQISSPNKAQTGFVSREYVPILVQPFDKSKRYCCPKRFERFRKGV